MPTDAKQAARSVFDAVRDRLIGLSHRIHAHPELGYEEAQASTWCAEVLDAAGMPTKLGVCGLPTAFVARAGSGPLHVAICAEYDALPAVGHACGHNIIAAMGVGAGIALKDLADDLGLTVSVIGTPAEEGGGGKIRLLDGGAFDGVHAAMMVHPAPLDIADQPMLAVAHFDVHYTGKEAHAAAFPELGRNAADAITVAQVAIGLLRQHMRPTDRVHGIVTHGGDAPNIVPAHTTAKFYVRADTLDNLDDIRTKVIRCFEAGALATGCELEVHDESTYAQVVHDHDIAAAYRRNAEALGRRFVESTDHRAAGSTDMGNVSLQIPSMHPMIGIDSLPAVNHQPEFAAHCVSSAADRALCDGTVAMAWTAIDLATNEAIRARLTGGT